MGTKKKFKKFQKIVDLWDKSCYYIDNKRKQTLLTERIKEMRKIDKMKSSRFIDNGSWRRKNIRYRYYRMLHDAIIESHKCIWTTKKRYKRKAVLNECVYIPLCELLNQFSRTYDTTLFLGCGCSIAYCDINKIRII